MFPYSYNPNCNYNYNKNNRRSWFPPQNSYIENPNLYGQPNQQHWNFNYARSSINNYYYNNNNNNYLNRGQNNYRGNHPTRHTIQTTNRGINNSTIPPSNNNLTILPSTNKEADVLERPESDKNFTASNIIENGAEASKNTEKETAIPSEISYEDGNNDEVDMDIDSDVDTVPISNTDKVTTSPYNSDHRSYFNFLNQPKSNSTKRVTTEKISKIKRKNSTTGEEFHPIRPAKRKERSASIPSDLDTLLKSLGPSSIITRSKSRENLLLQEEMLTFSKKVVTIEKNSEMSAEQPKRIINKPENKPIRRSSMFVAKPNAEPKPQLVNRDPRLQNRNPLKMTIKSITGREGSMATISSNSTALLKAPTSQKDAHLDHQKKERIKTLFGDEDTPPKHSQTETVKTTSKEMEKKKDRHSKRKCDTTQKTKSSTKVKSDSTSKRHKSATNSRKSEKSLGVKKISKNLNISIHTNVEVEPMEEVVQTMIPEFEVVSKTAQPLIHGELIPSCRVIETSLQLRGDQVAVVDLENQPDVSEKSVGEDLLINLENLPDVSEKSVGEDLLIKTERLVEEFGCEGYRSSVNRDSPVTEDGDIFNYLRESMIDYEIVASDQNFDSSNERTTDMPQIKSIATDETLVHSPPLLHIPMEVQEFKFIPPETADVKPVVSVDSVIFVEDEDQVELVKIEHVDFVNKFVCDFHCYHLVETTVYNLSVNTATSIESKSNYLELFDIRKQIFDRVSRDMFAYFRKHEILNLDCKRLVEEICAAYTKKCASTISNLKCLRFLHNIILTWRRPVNDFMKRFCEDIGHFMMLSNMETDHEKNQPPKSTISSTSETVVTKDSTPSQTDVATTPSGTKQVIIISPRPIEQLLANPSVQQPMSSQTRPSVNNNLSSPLPQHQSPRFSPSSTQGQGASHQITSPQSTNRTADLLPPPSYQSTYEGHLNIARIRNSMESSLNRIVTVMPASSQTQNRKSRTAKKAVNKSQNQFIQPPQVLLQPPPPYSTNLNSIENLHRNMMPGQNKNIPCPTYHPRLQPNQNVPDTYNHLTEAPTSQTSLWSLQHVPNINQPRPQSKQFQNNSSLNSCHLRYLQPPGVPVHLRHSRPRPLISKNATHGSELHEQPQAASSVNPNTYCPSYSTYHNYIENQQRQHEVSPRAATASVENLPNDNLYFHGHELENYNARLQTAQFQHQVAVQPSLLVEQLGRPLRNSPHGYTRQNEVPTAQPRDLHLRDAFDSADGRLRSPLNSSSQFAVPHPSATPGANSQRTSQHDHEQQFQRLAGQALHIQKLASQQDLSSSNGNLINQPSHSINSRVAEITSTSKTPDIESSISPSGDKSYTRPNIVVLNSEPVITTVVVKTEVLAARQIDAMECITIDDDDDDNNSRSEDPGLSSPTITSSLNTTQTQDNALIINLSKVCICNEEAIFICVCKKALYCSIECQEKDWSKHSFVCA